VNGGQYSTDFLENCNTLDEITEAIKNESLATEKRK